MDPQLNEELEVTYLRGEWGKGRGGGAIRAPLREGYRDKGGNCLGGEGDTSDLKPQPIRKRRYKGWNKKC